MTEEEEAKAWVLFASDRMETAEGGPAFWPAAIAGPLSLIQAVRIRDRDGHLMPMPTPTGVMHLRAHWIACLDHPPTRPEMASLIRERLSDGD